MAIRHHRDLQAWQVCDALRRRIGEISGRAGWGPYLPLRDQLRRAANSACSNVAEGFWRYAHPEFARFTLIARASLGEISSHLDEALAASLISVPEYQSLQKEIDTALNCVSGLLRYLRSTDAPERWRKRDKR